MSESALPRVSEQSELLLALAARCEVEKPSKTLDADIGRAVGETPKIKNIYRQNRYPRELLRTDKVFPAYTTSLDAAVTLVPEGKDWQAGKIGNECAAGIYPAAHHPFATHKAKAATPALALCAAALRARAAIAGQA